MPADLALDIVVRHRRADQAWGNDWADDSTLRAIMTTPELVKLLTASAAKKERVLVHRCAFGDQSNSVCCSVLVELADPSTRLVRFSDPVVLDRAAPGSPVRGQNFYFAAPMAS